MFMDQIVDKAITFATIMHSGTVRKGTQIPYIMHPMEAAAIVSSMTEDKEVIAASLLHDVLEDTGCSYEQLEAQFGGRIASLVAQESENKREDQPAENTWQIRKEETLKHLATLNLDAKMIALGDKLANIRAIKRDFDALGDKLWERFNQKEPKEHAWYYSEIAKIFGNDEVLSKTAAYKEYARLVSEVFGSYLPG